MFPFLLYLLSEAPINDHPRGGGQSPSIDKVVGSKVQGMVLIPPSTFSYSSCVSSRAFNRLRTLLACLYFGISNLSFKMELIFVS